MIARRRPSVPRAETYLGVPSLSHRGRIDPEQDELLGHLWLQDPPVAESDEPHEAVAAADDD
jgi:hypothetical protein